MIIIVDENEAEMEAMIVELKMRNYECTIIRNADRAYRYLQNTDNVDLVIIDVMLAVADNDSRYQREQTDDYLTTGIALLDDLRDQQGAEFIKKCVFLSNASRERLVQKIKESANRLGIPFWRKFDFASSLEFSKRVITHLAVVKDL